MSGPLPPASAWKAKAATLTRDAALPISAADNLRGSRSSSGQQDYLSVSTPISSNQSLFKVNVKNSVDLSASEGLEPSTQRKEMTTAERPTAAALARDTWARTVTKWRGLHKVVRAHPRTAVVPVLVFIVAAVVGCLGVWAGSRAAREQMLLLTNDAASSAARETGMMLQLWAAPAIAAVSVIREQTFVPTLINDITDWMEPLVESNTNSLAANATSFSLALLPYGVITAIYPTSPENLAMLNLNLLTHPAYSNNAVTFASAPAGTSEVLGPMRQPVGAGSRVFLVGGIHPVDGWGTLSFRVVAAVSSEKANYFDIWLPSSNANHTWGMDQSFTFDWASHTPLGNHTQAPWQGPCGSNCAAKPQADGTFLVFWGFVIVTVPAKPITDRLDSMAESSKKGVRFNYVLYRNDIPSPSDMQVLEELDTLEGGKMVIAETPGATQRATDVESVCQSVPTTVPVDWTVCVAPVDGCYPSWMIPAGIAVIFASLVLALLMLMLMLSHANHKSLVRAMLPRKAVKHLSMHQTYAEPFQMVTILFSDIVSYTELSSQLSPMELVQMLDHLYSGYDDLVDKHGLYKVETIGDAFMCVGGALDPCNPHDAARRVAQMALDMIKLTDAFETSTGRKIQIRVGMHSGNVTAAVMGRKMPHWCLVGDAVNVSSRMESNSRPMQVHVGATTAFLLGRFPEFDLKPRGAVDIKGKGPMCTYWLTAASLTCQVPVVPEHDLALAEVGVQLRSHSSSPAHSAC